MDTYRCQMDHATSALTCQPGDPCALCPLAVHRAWTRPCGPCGGTGNKLERVMNNPYRTAPPVQKSEKQRIGAAQFDRNVEAAILYGGAIIFLIVLLVTR